VTELLARVAAEAHFPTPAIATGTLVSRSDAGEKTIPIRLAGRHGAVRIDAGDDRAIARRGKALLRRGETDPHLDVDAFVAGSNVRFGDLAPFTPRLLLNPQIVDDGLSGTVVAAGPIGASPYALLVVTVDPAAGSVTQVKYYEHAINNLVRRDGRSEWVRIAGAMRPGRIEMWDVQGRGSTEITLVWREAPDLGRAPFTRAGLAVPLPE